MKATSLTTAMEKSTITENAVGGDWTCIPNYRLLNAVISYGWQGSSSPEFTEDEFHSYSQANPRILEYLEHWRSEEFFASVFDGLISLAALIQDDSHLGRDKLKLLAEEGANAFKLVPLTFFRRSLLRHKRDPLGVYCEFEEVKDTDFFATVYQSPQSSGGPPASTCPEKIFSTAIQDLPTKITIIHRPIGGIREDFAPKIICLHESRHIFQAWFLRNEYSGTDDLSPDELDARLFQELVFTLFNPERFFPYDNCGFSWAAYCELATLNGISCLSEEAVSALQQVIIGLRSFQSKMPLVNGAAFYIAKQIEDIFEIYRANRVVVFYDHSVNASSTCERGIDFRKKPLAEKIEILALTGIDLKAKPFDSVQPAMSAFRAEYCCYLYKRTASLDPARGLEFVSKAALHALDALQLYPRARFAKYAADNLYALGRALKSPALRAVAESLFCDLYVFPHLSRLIYFGQLSGQSSIANLGLCEGVSDEIAAYIPTIREYRFDAEDAVSLAQIVDASISCSLPRDRFLRDFAAGAVLLSQIDKFAFGRSDAFPRSIDVAQRRTGEELVAIVLTLQDLVKHKVVDIADVFKTWGDCLISPRICHDLSEVARTVLQAALTGAADQPVQWMLPHFRAWREG